MFIFLSSVNSQFNDLLLELFRRVSSGRPITKERFIPTIIRVKFRRRFFFVRSIVEFLVQFAGRYSDHDAEQIENHGYAQASIDTKVRVLKVKSSFSFRLTNFSFRFSERFGKTIRSKQNFQTFR